MSTNETPRAFKVLGTTEEYDACDCCGRANLKCYVALEVIDPNAPDCGAVVFYGTGCAAKAEGIPARIIKTEAKNADEAKRAAERAEANRRHNAEQAAYKAWMTETHGTDDAWKVAESLGLSSAFKVWRMFKAAA